MEQDSNLLAKMLVASSLIGYNTPVVGNVGELTAASAMSSANMFAALGVS